MRLNNIQKKERLEMIQALSLKNVVAGRGHDCGG